MKKIIFSLALLPLFLYADGELAYGSNHSKRITKEGELTPFTEYHNRMAVFDPLHQVYERIKTDDLYAGVETWLLGVFSSKHFKALAEAEFRMGYNLFYNGRDHVTPFGGIGVIKDMKRHRYFTSFEELPWRRHHRHFATLPAVVYGVFGVLYDHEFNSVVNLGTNVKAMIGGGVNKKHHDWGGAVVGVDLSVPLTFRFGHKRHWDFRLEPFDIFLHGKNINMNYFGFRSTVGYRF